MCKLYTMSLLYMQ
uniref:Uncharacterized protein n=1 Tax=Arundo donax TaxID=35708 RepID=A0A0A9BXJ0_ARUDO